ncbi:MAG: hypothetical protein IT227_11440 [Flavobacteriales bacterium]|nr:hypothetical protein [Flavobacteriales bacterium]
MGARAVVLVVCLVGGWLAPARIMAQDEPRKAAIVSMSGLYGGAVKFNHITGPYDLMGGRNVVGYGLAAGLRHQVGSGRFLVRAELEYLRLPFTFTWEMNSREVYGLDRKSRQETYQAERMGLMGLWLGADYAITRSRSPFIVHLAAGVGWSQLDFYPRFGSRSVTHPDSAGVRYTIFTMTSEHRNGFVPLVRLGVGKEWQFANKNRLGVTALVQWSWVDDFNSGTYLAYPGTSSESRGTWKQGLNYIGLKAHYALGFGPGKVPRHLRGTE